MARDENLPFPLGTTYFGGETPDSAVGGQLEGQEYWVEDHDFSNGTIGANASRSGRKRKVRIVRNMNATALSGKEVVKVKVNGSTPAVLVGQVDGLAASYADKGYPVDELLPASGCAQYDLCYVVIDGLAKVVTDTAGDTTISIGGLVVPGAGTAGRVIEADATLTGANLHLVLRNALGVAAEAVAATSTSFTIDVGATRR